MSSGDLEALVQVVDDIDPGTLTEADVVEIKKWGADKVGFVLIDIDTQKILHATPGAESIFGYVTDEMIGLDLIELVPDEFRDAHVQHVKGFGKSMTAKSMGGRDTILYGKERDGQTFRVEISLFPRKFKSRKLCLANVIKLSKQPNPKEVAQRFEN